MSPMWRTALTHVFTAGSAALGTALWLSSQGVDLYAIVNQLNTVVVEAGKLIALVAPVLSGTFGVFMATRKQKLIDLSKDPSFKGAVVTEKLASEVPSAKVVDSVSQLPAAAKIT